MLNKISTPIANTEKENLLQTLSSDAAIKIVRRDPSIHDHEMGYHLCFLCSKAIDLHSKKKWHTITYRWIGFREYVSTGYYLCGIDCVKLFRLGYAEFLIPKITGEARIFDVVLVPDTEK